MANNHQLDVFLFTFNCAKRGVDPEIFTEKVLAILPDKLSPIYVFGVEELCSALDGTNEVTANRHFLILNKILLQALVAKYGVHDVHFHTLAICHIGAIGLVAVTPFPSRFSRIRTATAARGYCYTSLKGAAGLRLSYSALGTVTPQETVDLTFCNAHLSANEGDYYFQKRNEDVLSIMRSLDFGDGFGFLKPNSHSFFMGDLNYRTTKKLSSTQEIAAELRSLQDQTSSSSADEIEELVYKYDELSEGIRNDDIFMGFTEACITFQPTYKYHIGTAIYNAKRSPSWCDRILYQSTYEANMDRITRSKEKALPHVNVYNSLKEVFTSDHQPVFLHITIPLKAPQSIVSTTGYLKILPNDQVIDHFHRKSKSSLFNDTASGPTQIYVKPTKIDWVSQQAIAPAADYILGTALWLTTTSGGRSLLAVALLVLFGIYIYCT